MQKLNLGPPSQLEANYRCELHLTQQSALLFLATYSYDWDSDTHLSFSLLSEVAEGLTPAFIRILRRRGLKPAGVFETDRKPFLQDLLTPGDSPAGRRWHTLMPAGVPRWVRYYDNEGRSADRYTAVFTGRQAAMSGGGRVPDQYPYLAMSGSPFHPQGVGMHGHTDYSPCDALGGKWPPAIGRKNHLGTRIKFEDLPPDCQRLVMGDYMAIWKL